MAMSSLNLSDNAIGAYRDINGFIATPEGTDFILSHTLPFLSLSMPGPAAIAGAIKDMGALTLLNLANNSLGELVLPEGWTKTGDGMSWSPFVFKHADGREQKDNPSRPAGIIAIANVIPDMGAILSVNLLKNRISVAQAENLVSILKEHPTLKSLCGNSGDETELDMSGKMKGATDAIMLVPEIVDNGAVSQFTFSGDSYESKPVTMETSLVEADFSGKVLGVSGAIMVGAFLPNCM
jgi:hypothetical protein